MKTYILSSLFLRNQYDKYTEAEMNKWMIE